MMGWFRLPLLQVSLNLYRLAVARHIPKAVVEQLGLAVKSLQTHHNRRCLSALDDIDDLGDHALDLLSQSHRDSFHCLSLASVFRSGKPPAL